jgi:hypothetical protein
MKNKGETKLISASTILILSGFLIGLTVGNVVSESLSPYVLSCGLSGFLAFIALEFTGNQREEEEAHEEQAHVQGRLDRHVMSLSSISFVMSEAVGSSRQEKSQSKQSDLDTQKLDDLYDQLLNIDDASESQILKRKRSAQS